MQLNPISIMQHDSHHKISPATVYEHNVRSYSSHLEQMSSRKKLLDIGRYWLIYCMHLVSGILATIIGYEPAALPFLQ